MITKFSKLVSVNNNDIRRKKFEDIPRTLNTFSSAFFDSWGSWSKIVRITVIVRRWSGVNVSQGRPSPFGRNFVNTLMISCTHSVLNRIIPYIATAYSLTASFWVLSEDIWDCGMMEIEEDEVSSDTSVIIGDDEVWLLFDVATFSNGDQSVPVFERGVDIQENVRVIVRGFISKRVHPPV